ncbi:MAG: pyridoxal phosphate-dependent aminotransferase [Deltaproteobacteria bacterium]|nr:pyridoxal phosphate-dependent aminotransferase [Deltaproteobacteria bacterium]
MITKRAKDIPPFIVMDVLERGQELERAGRDIIHMEVGEPDFETPECIKQACYRAIRDGKTHYTNSLGILELREAVAEYYYTTYGVSISPDQVIITSGSSPAMYLLFSALLEKDDEVIVSDPHYACYPNFIRFIGGSPIMVNVYEEEGFQYTPEAIREKMTKKTKGILINSPSNPTGNILGPERMEAAASMGVPIISDEIYQDLVYEGTAHSILEYTDNAFVFNGFSKAFAMTGWRLGYIIAPKDCIRPMQKIQQNLFICANSFVQWAGVAALKEAGEDVKRMKTIFNERRTYIIQRLRDLGLGIAVEPTGAFYILGRIKHFSMDSYRTAFDILERVGVGVSPGIDFGANCEGYIRFSYATSLENIRKGLDRIENYLNDIGAL